MQPPSSNHHSATSSLSNSNTHNNSVDKSTPLSSYDHSNLSLSTHELNSNSSAGNHNLLTMNSIQSLLTNGSNNQCKQEKFKFSTLNDTFPTRTFSAIKTSGNNIKDQQQVN
jgi:hypothetical protein